jgi:hypothetical protein
MAVWRTVATSAIAMFGVILNRLIEIIIIALVNLRWLIIIIIALTMLNL